MNDKLDELHLIYKMIGNYGFCTVQDLLEKYCVSLQKIDKAIEYIEKEIKDMPNNGCSIRLKEISRILIRKD